MSGGNDGRSDLSPTLRRIERAAGALASASVSRMDETLPWFRGLPADQRSWVMLIAQAGVRSL
ncbi:MAG TPA: PucR family transcriptional regulator, partial [Pilimelia sp.]|nr:PucR family transcriptional regulator [Pilimelia sp.]